jgi:hypothetical protein
VPLRHLCRSILVAAMIAGVVACATTPDPPLPDLSASMQETQTRMLSLTVGQRSIQNDLEQFLELKGSLSTVIERAEQNDYALSLLRLVAMNCLNTEYGEGITEVASTDAIPLSCRPAHFDILRARLEEAPETTRDQALELLFVVDQIRILRGSMRRRMARLPQTLSDHRDFIVEERAMLRRLEAELARRRSQYSPAGWGEIIDRISEYRVLLREFEIHLDVLEEDLPTWPSLLDEVTGDIYFALAEIRSPASR